MRKNLKTIKKLMINRDIFSEAELARRCGKTRQFINLLIRGERKSGPCTGKLAAVLGVPTERMSRLLKSTNSN